jgi:hypothetical protein
MSSTRPLHELLADLAGDGDAGRAHGDPEAYLAANGHAGLPPDLVAEAVVSYADTAPVEVAEHLAPFVTTHSAVPADEPPSDVSDDWFDLLTTAPAAPTDDLDPDPGLDDDLDGDTPWSPDDDPGPGLDFGTGSADDLDAPADADDSATDNDDTSPAGTHDQPAREAWTDLEPESADLDALPAAEADEDSDEDDSDDLS